jgi:4-carboxymuconolactone decarboxylase
VSAAGPRLAPLPKEQWDDEVTDALRRGFGDAIADRFLSDAPDALTIPNALTTLMHHPTLAGPFLAYNNVLLSTPALEPRLRELLVLRVAWRTRSEYEWVQHVRLAPRCGVTADEISAIADGSEAAGWTDLERDLLAATDELVDRARIDDATWTRLAEQLDEARLIEVVFVVGTYVCLAMVFNSLGVQLDAELAAVAAPPLPEPPGPASPSTEQE